MVSKYALKELDMDSIEDYYEYIMDSKTNGQHAQARALFRELSEGMQGQRADFFNWIETTYYYDAQDSEQAEDLANIRLYFNSRFGNVG
jgi:hypothetical protein